ncbi:MAG: hypothetical protein ACT4OX_15560 [Actinomycetota bacterium]
MSAMTSTTRRASHTAAPANVESAASLLARARDLRSHARRVNPILADAYLRRSAELSLEAWARAVRSQPVDIEAVQAAVAAA